MPKSKAERLSEFFRRLAAAAAPATVDEAFSLVARTMTEVENEMTDIPNNPASWQTDGRLYPPERDSVRQVKDNQEVVRFRSRGHNTFVRTNGAVEIRATDDNVVFAKVGADGRGVWDE